MPGDSIYIDGTYLNKNPDWGSADSAWKAGIIQQLLVKNNIAPEEITEVGCGAGLILEELSKKNGGDLKYFGYDISPQAIALARKRETQNLHFFNEDFVHATNIHSDVLLVIDVLEHVEDYYGFLKKIKSKGNYFVFHIPLDLSCRTVLKSHILLQQRESVGHIHYFTKEIVLWFLRDSGFHILDWKYTKPALDKDAVKGFKNGLKKRLRNFSFSINKDNSAKLWGNYSMLILAK